MEKKIKKLYSERGKIYWRIYLFLLFSIDVPTILDTGNLWWKVWTIHSGNDSGNQIRSQYNRQGFHHHKYTQCEWKQQFLLCRNKHKKINVFLILRDIRYQRRLLGKGRRDYLIVSLIKCSVIISVNWNEKSLLYNFKNLTIGVFCILSCLYHSPKHQIFHRRYSVFV